VFRYCTSTRKSQFGRLERAVIADVDVHGPSGLARVFRCRSSAVEQFSATKNVRWPGRRVGRLPQAVAHHHRLGGGGASSSIEGIGDLTRPVKIGTASGN